MWERCSALQRIRYRCPHQKWVLFEWLTAIFDAAQYKGVEVITAYLMLGGAVAGIGRRIMVELKNIHVYAKATCTAPF